MPINCGFFDPDNDDDHDDPNDQNGCFSTSLQCDFSNNHTEGLEIGNQDE